MLKPTVTTLKPFSIAITLPFNGMDMSASVTGLRRVSRWDENHSNTRDRSFVGYKDSQLIERPIVCSTPLSLVSRLLVQTLSDVGQVFKSQCRILRFSVLYKLFADVVIQPFLEPPLSPRKPSRQSATRPSAFGLNVSSDLAVSVTNGLNLFATPTLFSAGRGNVTPSQIDSDHFWSKLMDFNFDLQDTIDNQQRLVVSLQSKAAEGVKGATSELADAIAGLRDLQVILVKPPPNALAIHPTATDYQIR